MFGFLKRHSKFRRMSDRMRINNVREMLKMRLRNDPLARSSGIDPDGLDDRMIDALPEMTVFKQVQCYLMFRCSGASELQAMESLHEMHQHILEVQRPAAGSPPTSLDLESWILFIVRIMHPHGTPISTSHLKECIAISGETYPAYKKLLPQS
jgi:hypothetical protein